MVLLEEQHSDFQLPAYLEELLHELDVSQPLLRADAVAFKVETQEEGEGDYRQESLADGEVKENKEQEDGEASASAAAAAAARAAKLAAFADKTILAKRKKQTRRKVYQGPQLEPQILWKPDANGGRPVPKREDLKGCLANQEREAPRNGAAPSPWTPRRLGTKQKGNARALVESPGSRPGSRPNTGNLPTASPPTLPGLDVLVLEVGNGDASVYGELPPQRPTSAERRPSTAERTRKMVECPMLVKAMPGRHSAVMRQLVRRSPGPPPPQAVFRPSSTLDSLPSSCGQAEEDFYRQISPHAGVHYASPTRQQLLLPLPGSPSATQPSTPRFLSHVALAQEDSRREPSEGASPEKVSSATVFEVQLPRLQHQGSMDRDSSTSSLLRGFARSDDLSEPSQSQGTLGVDPLGAEDSQLLGPLPSSHSVGSGTLQPPQQQMAQASTSTSNESTWSDLDKDNKDGEQQQEVRVPEEDHQGSQLLAPSFQEATQSYHSMLDGPRQGSRRGSMPDEAYMAQDADFPDLQETMEFEEEQVQYVVPPWALREHLHLDAERYLPRDDTPMDPEVCEILKGLERAPALQLSRPHSRASPSPRPCSASRLCSSDYASLMPAIYAPRGAKTAEGHRTRRHLVTPSPTLSNPDSLMRPHTENSNRDEGGTRPAHSRAALGTTVLCLLHPSRSSVKAQIASQCMLLLNAGRSHGRTRRSRARTGTAASMASSPQEELEAEMERPATQQSWKYSASEDSPSPSGSKDPSRPSVQEEIFH